jgi:hypothetical protein
MRFFSLLKNYGAPPLARTRVKHRQTPAPTRAVSPVFRASPHPEAYGIRERASEIATRELGRQTELEVTKQLEREVDADRFTGLDQMLIAEQQGREFTEKLDPSEPGRRHWWASQSGGWGRVTRIITRLSPWSRTGTIRSS